MVSEVSTTNLLLGLYPLMRKAHQIYTTEGRDLPGADKAQTAYANTQGLSDLAHTRA